MDWLRYRQVKFSQQFVALVFKILGWVGFLTSGRLFFRLNSVGLENLSGLEGPVIFTPNHKSYVDHFFIGAAVVCRTPALPIGFVAADWLFNIRSWWLGPLARLGLWLLGAYPVLSGKGLNVSLATPELLLGFGYNFCIYPEGKIQFRPGIYEVKVGAAYLARKTGIPVLPVALRGMEYFSMSAFFTGRRNITVVFGTPFNIGKDEDVKEASERIRLAIAALYESGGSGR